MITAIFSVDAMRRSGAVCAIRRLIEPRTQRLSSRLDVLGLSVRRFAAMTGVQYETARHWGGHPQARWVPPMVEMMVPSVSRPYRWPVEVTEAPY